MEGTLDFRLKAKKISKIFGGPQGGTPKMVIFGKSPMGKSRIYLKLFSFLIGFLSSVGFQSCISGLYKPPRAAHTAGSEAPRVAKHRRQRSTAGSEAPRAAKHRGQSTAGSEAPRAAKHRGQRSTAGSDGQEKSSTARNAPS